MPNTSLDEPEIITEYETMMYKRRGRVAYIMFNRPQALNAVNDQFEEDLHSAMLELTWTMKPGWLSSTAQAGVSAPALTSSKD